MSSKKLCTLNSLSKHAAASMQSDKFTQKPVQIETKKCDADPPRNNKIH